MNGAQKHAWRIAVLLLLTAAVQAWVVARNELPAQDAVPFLRFARQLDHQPLVTVLRSNAQHPLYPLLVWSAHAFARVGIPGTALDWVRVAQYVAASAAVLLVVPIYLAGVRLSGPTLAAGAAALFTVLPFASRMGADALSDSTYLLATMTGFWTALEFLCSRRPAWLGCTGLATGFGFLARPEAMLLPAAILLTLAIVQCRPQWRMPWRTAACAALSGIVGLLVIVAPYAATVQKLTPKGSLNLIPGGARLFSKFDRSKGRPRVRAMSDGRTVTEQAARTQLPPPAGGALDFALPHRTADQRFSGYWGAVRELLRELVEGLHYVFGLLVLLGLFTADRKPGNVLCSVLAILFLAMLVQFASRSGYIASRHVLTLVCLASYVAARGGWAVAGVISRVIARAQAHANGSEIAARQARVAAVLLVAACLFCLPRSAAALHSTRQAHAAAGRWLAQFASADSIVLDSRGWASLYSGLPAYDSHGARLAFEDPRLAYVVLESAELSDERPRGATLRHLLSSGGEPLVEFPVSERAGGSVWIYAWHADRLNIVNRAATLRAN